MDTTLGHTIGYLGIAILVAIIARRIHLPYTVGLVVAGIGMAATGLETGEMLTHDFIFDVILPPLLFEAALSIQFTAGAWLPSSRQYRSSRRQEPTATLGRHAY